MARRRRRRQRSLTGAPQPSLSCGWYHQIVGLMMSVGYVLGLGCARVVWVGDQRAGGSGVVGWLGLGVRVSGGVGRRVGALAVNPDV